MSFVFEPHNCPQCRHDSADFRHDSGTGDYEIACGRCGHYESHRLDYDGEGTHSGYTHTARKGAGVL